MCVHVCGVCVYVCVHTCSMFCGPCEPIQNNSRRDLKVLTFVSPCVCSVFSGPGVLHVRGHGDLRSHPQHCTELRGPGLLPGLSLRQQGGAGALSPLALSAATPLHAGCWKQTGWVLETNRVGNKESGYWKLNRVGAGNKQGGYWKQTRRVLETNRVGTGNKQGGYWKQTRWETKKVGTGNLTGWVLETNRVGTGNKQGGCWKQTGWVLETNRVGTGNKQGGKQKKWILET